MRIIDYINQGGPIMYVLLLLNIVGFALMFAKFYVLSKAKGKTDQITRILKEKIQKTLAGRIDPNITFELAQKEISAHMRVMEKGLNTIKIIASISPLLGLLGTVAGVFIAFQVMSETGLNNPSAFAKGISLALITTVGGLIVAIPHYIGHSYLLGIIDTLEVTLEKKLLKKLSESKSKSKSKSKSESKPE